GAEHAGHGRGRQRGSFAAATALKTVDDPAPAGGAVLQILLRLVDDALGDDDAGVASGAEALHLGDSDGAFVEVAAVGRGDVAPAAAGCLGLAGELHGLGQDLFEFLPASTVFFLAIDVGEEQKAEAVAVHVATHFEVAVRIAEQAVGLAAGHEPIDRFADAVGVFAVANRAPFHEHGHAGEACHRHRVQAAVRFPVAVAVLDLGEIVEAFANDFAVL